MPHRYTAYGLSIASELAVPWLPAGPDGAPDVTIRLGAVPDPLADGLWFWAWGPRGLRLNMDGLARFEVSGGSDILVEPAGGDEHEVAVFLVGSVLAACLQQRGVLTLHASAVETAAGAVLFLGHPGAGKSTLLASLIERGYAMLADDVTAVVPAAGGGLRVLPAFPSLRLWADAADMLGLGERTGRCRRVREGMDKYLFPVDRLADAPRGIRAAYVLFPANRPAIECRRLGPGDAVTALTVHTYQRGFLRGAGMLAPHFRATTALAGRVPVAELTRPNHRPCVAALASRVEGDLRSMNGEAGHAATRGSARFLTGCLTAQP